jgi:hypothetical protein
MHGAPLAGALSSPLGLPVAGTPARAAEKYTTYVPEGVLTMSGAQIAGPLAIHFGRACATFGIPGALASTLVGCVQGPPAVMDVDSCGPVRPLVPVENA